jgi:hypothetical protein
VILLAGAEDTLRFDVYGIAKSVSANGAGCNRNAPQKRSNEDPETSTHALTSADGAGGAHVAAAVSAHAIPLPSGLDGEVIFVELKSPGLYERSGWNAAFDL